MSASDKHTSLLLKNINYKKVNFLTLVKKWRL